MKNIRKSLLLTLIMLVFMSVIRTNAQVLTRILGERESIEDIIPHHVKNPIFSHILPTPNVALTLKEDEKQDIGIDRFAIKVLSDYTINNGEFIETETSTNWLFSITSDGATSLNFQFSNLFLPIGVEMYIYSENKKMIIGPITNVNINEGYYASDIIYGHKSIIEVVIPKESKKKHFDITISSISHGIKSNNLSNISYRGIGESLPCNVNVNCAGGLTDEWKVGVALILVDGEGLCSGSLVKDECNTERPFFLTASHCWKDNSLAALEQSWVFVFNFESYSCNGSTSTSHYSISGAEFKAKWGSTDFLLLELLGTPLVNWNYIQNVDHGYVPLGNYGWCIHHPVGDIKKIAFTRNVVVDGNDYLTVTRWESGIIEDGSSGAPLFYGNGISGQMSHTRGGHLIECDDDGEGSEFNQYRFGSTYSSWSGGGTSKSQLSSWLSSDIPADFNDIMTSDMPSIICNNGDGRYFCTHNVQNCTYSISPQDWFEPIDEEDCCNLIKVKNTFNGHGWAAVNIIGDFLYGDCFLHDTIIKRFWVGEPDFELEIEETNICPRDMGIASVIPIGGFNNPQFDWSFSGAINGTGSTILGRYRAIHPGVGYVCCTVANQCGTTIKCKEIIVEECEKDRRFSISPNPANGIVTVTLSSKNHVDGAKKHIKIIDNNSNVRKEFHSLRNVIELDISSLEPGIYMISILSGNVMSSQKLVKL